MRNSVGRGSHGFSAVRTYLRYTGRIQAVAFAESVLSSSHNHRIADAGSCSPECPRKSFNVISQCAQPSVSTPAENPTVPPVENPTDRRGDEPQFVVTS